MQLRSHFNLGDKVWDIITTRVDKFDECPSCELGIIKTKDSQLKCPRCLGKGLISGNLIHKWKVKGPYIVGQVRLEVSLDNTKEQYMLHETGVGSGTVYDVENMFETPELAQAEVDKRNNQISQQWCCSRCVTKYSNIVYQTKSHDWRHCSVHEQSTQHVVLDEAEVALGIYNEREAKRLENEQRDK